MKRQLKQPADPADVTNLQENREALKHLKRRKNYSRRTHAHAVTAIDAIFRNLQLELASTPLHARCATISACEKDLQPYFWLEPTDEELNSD